MFLYTIMNPQDVRSNADRLRVRDDYLAVLRQQEANLQKTANAMSVMATTGQPPVAPSDMRSISEKLVDIERLKPMFRKQLSSLMDGKEASNVMNVLTNEEIQFASTIFGEIYNELKGKYPLGVPAPIFVEFLQRFLKDYNKSIGFLPKSKEERDALNPENALEGTAQYLRIQQEQLEREIEDTDLARQMRQQDNDEIVAENQMREKYNEAFDIASPSEIAETARNIIGNDRPKSLTIAKRILGFDKLTPEEVFKYTNPSKTEIVLYIQYDYFRNFGERFTRAESSELNKLDMNELRDIFVELRGGDNLAGAEELVGDLPQTIRARELSGMSSEDFPAQSSLSSLLPLTAARRIRKVNRPAQESAMESSFELELLGPNATAAEISEAIKKGRGRPPKYTSAEEAKAAKRQQTKESKQRTKLRQDIENKLDREIRQAKINITQSLKLGNVDQAEYEQFMYELEFNKGAELYRRLQREQIEPSAGSAFLYKIPAFSGAAEFQGLEASILPSELYETGFESGLASKNPRVAGSPVKKMTGTGAAKHTKKLIVGRGLKPKKEFAEKVDFSISTLPANKSYVPFGKYVLNQRRLNENKLMVRTVKGGAISGIPTLAISPVLGGIIKKMVGGSLPSYNEMSNLSEDEQNTLYKIFKMSEVDNADLLPAPNKTKEESEMNRFQILKGQITSGNDNTELIKEFKVMLLKFIHNGKVPRGQGMEIIFDLMAMGH
jgi:hypothetical protein